MTTHAFPAASLICAGRRARLNLMREPVMPAPGADATEFQEGMHATVPHVERGLAKHQLLVLPAEDLTVLCLEGELWLTRDGDIEDYILGPGQSLTVRRGDQAAVQALQPGRLRLIAH